MKDPRRPTHDIVIDLGFGDSGKGTIVDWLARTGSYDLVVRFNGGAQAGHNVLTEDGRAHCFAQFGSGTLAGLPTHLSQFMMVEPMALAAEAAHLESIGVPDPLGLLTIDARALLITPAHVAANQAREAARGNARHGSCGIGIGETVAYAKLRGDEAPRVGDCTDRELLARKLTALAAHYGDLIKDAQLPVLDELLDAYAAFAGRVRITDAGYLPAMLAHSRAIFEGAQGVLLDEWHGFHPHTTWSATVSANAEALIAESGQAGAGNFRRIGVLRAYTTRHGQGPMPTYDLAITAALPEAHNHDDGPQGPFRAGHLDMTALRYAVAANGGIDALALTHLDRYEWLDDTRVAWAYRLPDGQLDTLPVGGFHDRTNQLKLTDIASKAEPILAEPRGTLVDFIEAELGAPVIVTGWGPTAADKVARADARLCPLCHEVTVPAARTRWARRDRLFHYNCRCCGYDRCQEVAESRTSDPFTGGFCGECRAPDEVTARAAQSVTEAELGETKVRLTELGADPAVIAYLAIESQARELRARLRNEAPNCAEMMSG